MNSKMTRRLRVAAVAGLVLAATLTATSSPAAAAAPILRLRTALEALYERFDRSGTYETFSGAAFGDITGDGVPEVVSGGPDGILKAWKLDGRLFFQHRLGRGGIQTTPTLVDIDGNGVLDILAGALSGEVEAVDGRGRRLFKATDRWDMPKRGVFGTPAAVDMDRDGALEIVATSWDHHVHAWELDGRYMPGFPVFVNDTIWSSPAIGDLNGDGWNEIVFGGDMDEYPGAPYPKGGMLWAVRHDGRFLAGWPRSLPGQATWSSPALTDLDRDGWLDVVVGTGTNWPEPAGRRVYAIDRFGRDLAGWPAATGGQVMASPAVGDLDGDGLPEVVVLSADGRVTAFRPNGQRLWRVCAASNTATCKPSQATNGQVTLADVDSDGVVEVVSAAEGFLRILSGPNGFEEAEFRLPGAWAPPAAPAVTEIDGETWIALNTTIDTRPDGRPGVGDHQVVFVWSTGLGLGEAPWPTFKQNNTRTGMVIDRQPPTAEVLVAPVHATTRIDVAWTGQDHGPSGLSRFNVDLRLGDGPWYRWLRTTSTSATLWTVRGQQYQMRVRAVDLAGNVGKWTAPASFEVLDTAVRAQPMTAGYAVAASGALSALSSPPAVGPALPGGLGRDVAVRSSGRGGYVLDAFGGLHPFGEAPRVGGTGWWPGWDMARAVALNADGSGYTLDAWGGLHPIGGARRVRSKYFHGQDVARDLVLLPTSTASKPAGYTLDVYGGVHRFGDAPKLIRAGRRWDFPVARSFALSPSGNGGWILDGWGGLHAAGRAPRVVASSYWKGWDIARAAVALNDQQGYVLDGHGGIHPWGGAPLPEQSHYWGSDVGRGLAMAP